MPNITPAHHKLSVTFRLDQEHLQADLVEARSLARSGATVTLLVPPGIRFPDEALTLENNMIVLGCPEDIPPILLES